MKSLILLYLLFFSTILSAQESLELLLELDKGMPGYDDFGYCVSYAGDVNNDGYEDILISVIEPSEDTRIGKVYIYSGNFNITGIKSNPAVSNKFALYQNYPNPFNPTTTINYEMPESGYITIKVYDLLGREVKTLVTGNKSAGNYKVEFNASDLVNGIYFYRMDTGKISIVKKMMLMK